MLLCVTIVVFGAVATEQYASCAEQLEQNVSELLTCFIVLSHLHKSAALYLPLLWTRTRWVVVVVIIIHLNSSCQHGGDVLASRCPCRDLVTQHL